MVGTYDGRCIFFSTDQLKYHTTIHVRSARGKNAQGRKVTGIEPMPGEDKILITSNDSRIRLYDLRDLSLVCKYRGYTNLSSQIRACFSPDGRYICAGSENQCVFLWSSMHVPQVSKEKKYTSFDSQDIPLFSPVVGSDCTQGQKQLLRGHQGSQCCSDLLTVCSCATAGPGGCGEGEGGKEGVSK